MVKTSFLNELIKLSKEVLKIGVFPLYMLFSETEIEDNGFPQASILRYFDYV